MIADWIYNLLASWGYYFNKGIGIKDVSEVSNIKTAIIMLIMIIIGLTIIVILSFVEFLRKRGKEKWENI